MPLLCILIYYDIIIAYYSYRVNRLTIYFGNDRLSAASIALILQIQQSSTLKEGCPYRYFAPKRFKILRAIVFYIESKIINYAA